MNLLYWIYSYQLLYIQNHFMSLLSEYYWKTTKVGIPSPLEIGCSTWMTLCSIIVFYLLHENCPLCKTENMGRITYRIMHNLICLAFRLARLCILAILKPNRVPIWGWKAKHTRTNLINGHHSGECWCNSWLGRKI